MIRKFFCVVYSALMVAVYGFKVWVLAITGYLDQ